MPEALKARILTPTEKSAAQTEERLSREITTARKHKEEARRIRQRSKRSREEARQALETAKRISSALQLLNKQLKDIEFRGF